MIKKLYGLISVTIIWYLLYLILQTPAIPNPISTIQYTIMNLNTFIPHIMVSLTRILVALFISGLVGIIVGILMGVFKPFKELFAPLVYILYPIPKIAFLPVFMLLFGLGETPKVVLIFSVIVFQFILSTQDAIESINKSYFDSVHALGLTGFDVLKHCIIPAILPSVFTSIRIAIGVSIAILFFAENFSTKLGIGYFIMNSYAIVNYASMYAGVIVLSILGLVLYSILDYLEAKVCPWNL